MTRLAMIAVLFLCLSATAWGQADSRLPNIADSVICVSPIWHTASTPDWGPKSKLVCPTTPGTYRLEMKIDTVWAKCGMDKQTKLILYEAKPDTLWRWIDATPVPKSPWGDIITVPLQEVAPWEKR